MRWSRQFSVRGPQMAAAPSQASDATISSPPRVRTPSAASGQSAGSAGGAANSAAPATHR